MAQNMSSASRVRLDARFEPVADPARPNRDGIWRQLQPRRQRAATRDSIAVVAGIIVENERAIGPAQLLQAALEIVMARLLRGVIHTGETRQRRRIGDRPRLVEARVAAIGGAHVLEKDEPG